MGRSRVKIENADSRQVTFFESRTELLEKAQELGVLCDAQVAVIIFSDTGKLFEFSSCSMEQILAKYSKRLEPSERPTDEDTPEEPKVEDILKKEIEALELKLLQPLGKDLTGLDLKQLNDLEQQLEESLLSVKEKKEEILLQQLQLLMIQEQHALEENKSLRAQIVELQPLLPSTDCPAPAQIDYQPAESEDKSVNASPDRGSDYGVKHEDTNFCLGFLSSTDVKSKPTEAAELNVSWGQKRKRTG